MENQASLCTEDLNSSHDFMSLDVWIFFIIGTKSVLFSFADQEMSKFINHCNEVKAATAANKEGGQLSIVKPQSESSSGAKK